MRSRRLTDDGDSATKPPHVGTLGARHGESGLDGPDIVRCPADPQRCRSNTRNPSRGGPRQVVPYDIGSNRSTSSGSIVGAIFFSLAASTIVAGSSSFFSELDVIQALFQIVVSSPATNLQTDSA